MLSNIAEYESIEAWHQARVRRAEEEDGSFGPSTDPHPNYLTVELPNGETLAMTAQAVADRAATDRIEDESFEDQDERTDRFYEVLDELKTEPETLVQYVEGTDFGEVSRGVVRITGENPTLGELWEDAEVSYTSVEEAEASTDGGHND